jgi:hypothetical protein
MHIEENHGSTLIYANGAVACVSAVKNRRCFILYTNRLKEGTAEFAEDRRDLDGVGSRMRSVAGELTVILRSMFNEYGSIPK